MYYGNAEAGSQQNAEAVWDADYMMVQHLEEVSGTLYDSTSNNNDGTAQNGVVQNAVGKVNGADDFDGSNDYINVPHSGTITGFTTAFTASFWIKMDTVTGRRTILNKYNTLNNQRGYYIDYDSSRGSSRTLGLFASQDGVSYRYWYASFSPVAGSWYHIAVVWQSGLVPKFYINGELTSTSYSSGTITSIFNNAQAPLYIGGSYTTGRYFDGVIDEVRLSDTARLDNWIRTSFRNQDNPAAFIQVGAEETAGPPPNPVVLVSSDGTHSSSADLICYPSDTLARNIFNWYVNDVSLTNLLYTFDTNDPRTAKDYSPYSNNGIIHGATWTSNGIIGGAYYFDGESDYIKISDGGLGYFNGYPFPTTSTIGGDGKWSEITVELWVYLSADQKDVRLLTKLPSFEIGLSPLTGRTAPPNNRLFAGVWRQNGTDHTELGYLGYSSVTYATPLNNNTWYHVAFTYKDGVGLTLYVNGQAVGSASGLKGNIHCSSGEPLYIGWFDYFHGMIDEVRLYRRCLSQQQINQRYVETKDAWNDQSILKSQETKGFDVWKCQVIQKEKSEFSNTWSIDNTLPVAQNLKIGPRQYLDPSDTDDLRGLYGYYDDDGDAESGTEIQWYRNGVRVSDLDNTLTVPSSRTNVGDKWYFTVRPRDGIDFGQLATSPTVNIVSNNPPQVVGTPSLVKEGDGDLKCTPTTSDPDGHTVRSIYNWYVNNMALIALHMPFDTDNMFTTKDYSPNVNTGTITGATWTTEGLMRGAYAFDGNDVIAVADNPSLGGDGTWSEISIEFWIKVSEPLRGTRIIAKKVASASSGSYMVGFQTSATDPANTLFFGVTVGGAYQDVWDSNLTDPLNTVLDVGKWYHVICTYKSGPGLTIYINGTARVNKPLSGPIQYATPTSGDEPLFIGYDGGGTPNRYLKGTLDEVRIYRRALTPGQAQQCYLDSKDGLSGSSTVASAETKAGEVWKCTVIPNDRYEDGTQRDSNTVTV